MKKIILYCHLFFALMACLSLAQETEYPPYMPHRLGSEKIWFIPGWLHTKTPTGKYSQLLENTFGEKVHIYSWKADESWSKAKEEVTKEAQRLARKISQCPKKQRCEMILVGHSLGARMIAEASQELMNMNIRIKQVILLGAAVAFDAPQLKNIERIVKETPVNIFNKEDSVLRSVFNLRENTFACGFIGIAGNTSFLQFEVPSPDKNERTIVTEATDLKNHEVSCYLEFLKQCLDGKAKPSMVPDLTKINGLLAAVGLKTNSKLSLPTIISITIVEKTDNWEYGYYTLKDSTVYTIFDPFGRLVFYGELKDAETYWKNIKPKLNK